MEKVEGGEEEWREEDGSEGGGFYITGEAITMGEMLPVKTEAENHSCGPTPRTRLPCMTHRILKKRRVQFPGCSPRTTSPVD